MMKLIRRGPWGESPRSNHALSSALGGRRRITAHPCAFAGMMAAWVCLMLLGLPGPAGAQQKNEYIIEHTLTLPKGVVHAAVFSPR